MHTSVYKSCKIHHNGDYSGDVIITNKGSDCTPIGKKVSILYSTQGLVSDFFIHWKGYPEGIPAGKTVVIEVLLSDIEFFVEDFIEDKIIDKLESESFSLEVLRKIASILKIELP